MKIINNSPRQADLKVSEWLVKLTPQGPQAAVTTGGTVLLVTNDPEKLIVFNIGNRVPFIIKVSEYLGVIVTPITDWELHYTTKVKD